MTAVQGQSAFQKKTGSWGGIGTYVGVKISDLVGLVGGMVPGDTITAYGSDGYNQTFSYNNVFDAWPDPSIQGSMILAYSFNGTLVPTWTDGMRTAFLPADNAYSSADCKATTTPDESSSSASVRWVSSINLIVVNTAPWNVTVKKGASSMTYGGQQIKNMTTVSAWGGYKKISGSIIGPSNYTGVNVSLLLNTVGGMSSNDSLKLTARDNYKQTFNYTLATGTATVWTILSYKMNGTPLSSTDVPKIAFVGPSRPITTASLWAKAVSLMEVDRPPVVQPLANVAGNDSQSLTFTASATDPDGDSLTYTWSFGDSTPLVVGNPVTHIYQTAGTYTYTVWVNDGYGHNVSSSATASIAFNLTLVAGWNFATVPLVGYGYKASTIGLATGDEIVSWNSATQAYDHVYIKGISPPAADFNIAPNSAYWVWVATAKTLHLYGSIPTGSQSKVFVVPAAGGWVAVSFNSLKTTWHASDINTTMYSGTPGEGISLVAKYTGTGYVTYITGTPLNDFLLAPGVGYWCWATASGTLSYMP